MMRLPVKNVIILALAVLLVELLIMAILHQISMPSGFKVLVDSFVLVLLLSPVIYFLVYKPLKAQASRLGEEEAKYRELVENTEDLITQVNKEGLFTFVNQASTKILGVSPEECIGLSAFSFLHPDDRDRTKNWFEDCIADQKRRATIENRQVNKRTGKSHTVLWSTSFVYDDSGDLAGVGSIARDLTPIRDAEQKFQNLFEKMLDGFALHEIICDDDGTPVDYRFLEINPAFETQTGMRAEDLIGKTVLEVLPGIEKHWIDTYGRVALTGEALSFENYDKVLNKHFKVSAFCPAENQFACIFQDVTSSKKMEQNLIEEKNKMEAVIAALDDGITVQDSDFKIIYQNEIQKERQGEHEGEYCYKAYQGRTTVCDGCCVVKCFDDGQVHKRETSSLTAEGEKIFMEVSASPVKNSEGKIIGAVEAVRDITKRKLLEEQLRQSHKMEAVGTLAGGIAHDFNNLLTIILGYTKLIRKHTAHKSDTASSLDAISDAGNRAVEMVRQILTFSRQTELETGPVQIHLIVKEALKLLSSTLPSTIVVDQDIDPESGFVDSDSGQINQLIMNLCTNAYHAMRATGGIMTVTLRPVLVDPDNEILTEILDFEPGPYVKLVVKDTGLGIDKTIIDKIFEPYFSTKEIGDGTGLGLAVVHGIVTNHGGYLRVSSEPGKGTGFQIYLPRITEEILPEAEGISANKPDDQLEGGERILVVDDEELLAVLQKRLLESLGYKVEAIVDSNKALQTFKERPTDFDLIVTDMTMPRMTGTELSAEISKIRPDIPIILCTGYSELIDQKKASDFGINQFFTKPVGMDELAKAIREELDK
jgi:PAS domain S-box-containing protein